MKRLFSDRKYHEIFLLGTNYWPSSCALQMWRRFNPEELVKDLERMVSIGMNACRFFLFLPDFLPAPAKVDSIMISRLKEFAELANRHKIYLLPTLFVGHMSGEDWPPVWQKERDFFSDPLMLESEKLLISEVVRLLREFDNIAAYILSNELPNYAPGKNPQEVTEWVAEMTGLIRKLDPERPVCVGDGAWAPEILGNNSNYHLRSLNRYQDFVGLHFYPRRLHPLSHAFTAAFRIKLAANWQKPAIIEEFGCSTSMTSEENQANYYRCLLYSALINGARGVLNWCLNDFDLQLERPYSHHLFEEKFGIVTSDGREKTAARIIKTFAPLAQEITREWQQMENPVALLIPSDYYYPYPYLFKPALKDHYEFYLESFALLKRANLDVAVIQEPALDLQNDGKPLKEVELDPDILPVIFIPRFQFITKPFFQKIKDYVQQGGVVYFSFAIDSWVSEWQELAGVVTDCKFGVPDYLPISQLEIYPANSDFTFSELKSLQLPYPQDDPEASYAPVLKMEGETLLIDQFGHPLLTRRELGKGYVYFCSYPMEYLAFRSSEETWKAQWARVYNQITCRHIRRQILLQVVGDGVEYGLWESSSDQGLFLLILVNHTWEERKVVIVFQDMSDLKLIDFPDEQLQRVRDGIQVTLHRKEVCTMIFRKKVEELIRKESTVNNQGKEMR